jgi:hypothetical protein
MDLLRLNAFTGAPPRDSALSSQVARWIGAEIPAAPQHLGPAPRLADPCDWAHPEVGWGLVLPENGALGNAKQATAADAPEPIRRLLAHRSGVVLRWSDALPEKKLRRYYSDGSKHDPDVFQPPKHGTGKGGIPRYLLLYGGPDVLPWRLQYKLSSKAFVGRLDLEGPALENYVEAALSGWDGATACSSRTLTWAVDHGGRDITRLMRSAIASKVHAEFTAAGDLQAVFIDGSADPATGPALVAALGRHCPGMIVLTSHGMTGPLNDVVAMREQLGVPVDADFRTLALDTLLDGWSPDGAILYSHACCSAGSDAESGYEGLVETGSAADEVLRGVVACGATVAPLPRLLLGAERPLRAFLGHVEPTFDWTLKDRATNQLLTASLIRALYRRLYQPFPVGYAFEEVHSQASGLEIARRAAKRRATNGATPGERQAGFEEALTCRLVAQDLQSLVILGDPAEALF